MLSVILLNVIMLSVANKPFLLNDIMLSVTNKPFLLNVIMLSVIMLNVIMLNVVMLNVVAPFSILGRIIYDYETVYLTKRMSTLTPQSFVGLALGDNPIDFSKFTYFL
jgi:hypothetical protein